MPTLKRQLTGIVEELLVVGVDVGDEVHVEGTTVLEQPMASELHVEHDRPDAAA